MEKTSVPSRKTGDTQPRAIIPNDARYNKPQSMQLEIPFGISDGEADMEAAQKWIDEHRPIWEAMCHKAERMTDVYGYASMRDVACWARMEFLVGIKNGITPALARIMSETHEVAFRNARARCDGFVGSLN